MALKCKIKMTDKRVPVEGSVVGPEGKETGTCPECSTPGVMLSIVGGYVRAHVVASVPVPENNPQPATLIDTTSRRDSRGRVLKAGTGLKEPQTGVADTGVRVGDPRTAEHRRQVEIESVTGTGTVQVPRKVESTGKPLKSGAPRMVTKLVAVAATEEHVREALAYWQAKQVRYNPDGTVVSEGARQRKLAMIEDMFRRLKALSADAPAMVVDGQVRDTAAGHRGPTLVRGRAMNADEVTAPRERKGDKPVRPGCDGPLGRERADKRIVTVPEPVPVLTRAQKRNRRRKACSKAWGARHAGGQV